MAKRTILQLVSQLGEGIESDEIESLNETIEASDIANILEQTYKEILNRKTWEFMKGHIRQLEASTLGANVLAIPADVLRIDKITYKDSNGFFVDVTYLSAEAFMMIVQARNTANDNTIAIVNAAGVSINVRTDATPLYWTSFDEATVTFDAYDTALGIENLPTDSVIISDVMPITDFTDPLAVLNIPERMETLVFNEALVVCNYRLRQTADPRAERVARRQHISLRENEHITNKNTQERTYGRNSRSGR